MKNPATKNAAMLATIQRVIEFYEAHPTGKTEIFMAQMPAENADDMQQPLKCTDWIPAPSYLYIRVGETPLPVVALGRIGNSQIMPVPIVVWDGKLRDADSLPCEWCYLTKQ